MPEETRTAILAEMRRACAPLVYGGRRIDAPGLRDILNWADRIEAAAERERDEWLSGNHGMMRAALLRVKEARGRDLEYVTLADIDAEVDAALAAPPEPPSNAAALREALMFLVENEAHLFKADLTNGEYDLLEAIVIKARAALAAPARNCDRFGGDEDKLIEACLNERGLLVTENFRDVFSDWLLAPAKGGAV